MNWWWMMWSKGFLVTTYIGPVPMRSGAHYNIFEDDLLVEDAPEVYTKVCPGLCVGGLSIEDGVIETHTRPVEFRAWGLNYEICDV